MMPEPNFDNILTRTLNIQYPIIQGGMQWVGRAELASAVSNAGGLGIVTALTQPSVDALCDEIARCNFLTDRPFGVNLTVLPTTNPPDYESYLETIISSGIEILETAGRVPEKLFAKAKGAGMTIIHKCTTIRHARAAQRWGVDFISIDGFEAAGHPGEDDVPGLVLIPAAVRKLDIPVIASGGIGSGEGLAAAMLLGACGVNMGTRFCATQEAPIHPAIKQALVDADETDTNLIFRTMKNTGRVLKNAVSDEVVAIESRQGGATFSDIAHLVSGARGKAALESGEVDAGLVWASQIVGLIETVPSCHDLLQDIVRDCRARLKAVSVEAGLCLAD